ncbi:hypothetical protein AB4254_10890 [Vibrio breoganii]
MKFLTIMPDAVKAAIFNVTPSINNVPVTTHEGSLFNIKVTVAKNGLIDCRVMSDTIFSEPEFKLIPDLDYDAIDHEYIVTPNCSPSIEGIRGDSTMSQKISLLKVNVMMMEFINDLYENPSVIAKQIAVKQNYNEQQLAESKAKSESKKAQAKAKIEAFLEHHEPLTKKEVTEILKVVRENKNNSSVPQKAVAVTLLCKVTGEANTYAYYRDENKTYLQLLSDGATIDNFKYATGWDITHREARDRILKDGHKTKIAINA